MKLRRLRNMPGFFEIMSTCPICGHKGWCAIDEKQEVVHCMRVSSDDYFDSWHGRQYRHFLNDEYRVPTRIEVIKSDSVDKKENSHLNRVYRALVKELSLSSYHLSHLRNERNLKDEVIDLREYRTMPGPDRYKVAKRVIQRLGESHDLLGVPGFFVNDGEFGPYWTMTGASGLMFPFRSIYNEITGWQIRVDKRPLELDMKGAIKGEILQEIEQDEEGNRRARCELIVGNKTIEVILTVDDKKECYSKSKQFVFSIELYEGNKYWWWSSGSKDNGASIGGPIPYHFALPNPLLPYWNVGMTPETIVDCSEIWVTEGPLKADKGADALLKPFFGIPGVGSFPLILEPLLKLGCKHVVLAFDADVITTPEVERALEQCAEFFAEKTDMALSIAMWDLSLGKGIDDLTDNGYIPLVSKILDAG